MEEHARLATAAGVPRTIVPTNGAAIRLAPNGPALVSHERAGRLVLDGDVILPADGTTMLARRRLMANGYLCATLVIDRSGKLAGSPRVLSQGVPVEEDARDFISACEQASLKAASAARGADDSRLSDAVRTALRRVAREWTGKRPVTDVQVVRL
jgi:ribonuclease J